MATSGGGAPSLGLALGDEVDYNAVDGFWVPARVQGAEGGGAALLLRFAVGGVDVCHRVDAAVPAEARRISAAGACTGRRAGGRLAGHAAGPPLQRRGAWRPCNRAL
jgi:hypothetical protein